MGALKHHGKSIYSGFIPNKPFISSGITDLLSVVVSTEDFTMNRPDIAPALTEITVLGRTQTNGGGKAFMPHHDRHPGNTSSGCP